MEKLDLIDIWWSRLSEEERAAWGKKDIRFFSSDPFEWCIVVAGGAGKGAFHYPRNLFQRGQSMVMREIRTPSNWDKVLEKADIQPVPMP